MGCRDDRVLVTVQLADNRQVLHGVHIGEPLRQTRHVVRDHRNLPLPLRSIWLAALRVPAVPLPAGLDGAGAELTAGGVAEPNVPTIDMQASLDAAIQHMLAGGIERLVVLDDHGLVAGLLARRSLLRALAQASAA